MPNTCEFCQSPGDTTGAILNGSYGQACRDCRSSLQRSPSAHNAQYQRDRDREDHQKDTLQPWDRHGNPSTDFIRAYPDTAKDYFSPDELKNHG